MFVLAVAVADDVNLFPGRCAFVGGAHQIQLDATMAFGELTKDVLPMVFGRAARSTDRGVFHEPHRRRMRLG
jgi:hypothetical protein